MTRGVTRWKEANQRSDEIFVIFNILLLTVRPGTNIAGKVATSDRSIQMIFFSSTFKLIKEWKGPCESISLFISSKIIKILLGENVNKHVG